MLPKPSLFTGQINPWPKIDVQGQKKMLSSRE